MGIKKVASREKGNASSSSDAVDATAGATNVGRTPSAPEEVLRSRPRNLRSSGKRPLSAEEADRYEASVRRRGSSRSSAADPETIVISDDEETRGPTSAPTEHGRGLPADPNEFPTEIPPIALIASGQESAVPDSGSVRGLLQRMENALRQAAFIIYTGWGDSMSFFRHMKDSLEEIGRVGGARVAERCDRKLFRWTNLALHLEWLLRYNPSDDVQRLMEEIRTKKLQERKIRAKRVSEHEATIAKLRQRRLRRELGACSSAQEKSFARDPQRESTTIHHAIMRELQALHALHCEDKDALDALAADKLREVAKAQIQADWEKALAAAMADLTSFTVLDCAD